MYTFSDVNNKYNDEGYIVKAIIPGVISNSIPLSETPDIQLLYGDGVSLYNLDSPINTEDNAFNKSSFIESTINPSTGLAWTIADINSAEFGFKS